MRRGFGAGRATRCALVLAAILAAGPVQAHGFGERYDLPVPLWLYLTGAGLAVTASFVVMALFMRAALLPRTSPRINLLASAIARVAAEYIVFPVLRATTLVLYILVISAGLFGNQSPLKNIAPIMIWAIWWVGMAYASALIGNLWLIVNPLTTLFAWAERLYRRVRGRRELSRGLRYPDGLGVWPAVALFFAFTWMELVWGDSDSPAHVGAAVLAYSVVTWLGMYAFGMREWLRRGEVFSLVFGLLSRFAPTELRVCEASPRRDDASQPQGKSMPPDGSAPGALCWELRPYAVGLLAEEPLHVSHIVLVLFMLAAVSFDGFLETPAWVAIADGMGTWRLPASGANAVPLQPDGNSRALASSLGLMVAPGLFFLAFYCVCGLIARFGNADWPARDQPQRRNAVMRTAGLFVLTLIPIAIAYHLAHYLSFLASAMQYMVPIASDPFGFGWDLFGGARYFVRFGVVDTTIIWYTSVTAIVAGHIAAVFLGHALALREFPDRRAALRSQYPMLGLMVGYTMLSLWIIAQPIVSSRFG